MLLPHQPLEWKILYQHASVIQMQAMTINLFKLLLEPVFYFMAAHKYHKNKITINHHINNITKQKLLYLIS